jgi:hypothetical protein
VLLGLFCKLKFDESGLGGNFLLVAKTPSFLPQPNSSTSHEHKMKNDKKEKRKKPKKIHKLPIWKREKTDTAPMIISKAVSTKSNPEL